MNSIAKINSCAKIDSSNILDLREKLYFNEILKQELFAMDCSASFSSDALTSSSGSRQAYLQSQALLGNIMALAEQG